MHGATPQFHPGRGKYRPLWSLDQTPVQLQTMKSFTETNGKPQKKASPLGLAFQGDALPRLADEER